MRNGGAVTRARRGGVGVGVKDRGTVDGGSVVESRRGTPSSGREDVALLSGPKTVAPSWREGDTAESGEEAVY